MSINIRATIEDLYKVEGKAELVDGEMVLMSPTGGMPGRVGLRIATHLLAHEERVGGGHAFLDNVGFTVNLPHRQSFSPDAAWYVEDISMGFPRAHQFLPLKSAVLMTTGALRRRRCKRNATTTLPVGRWSSGT